MAVRGGAGGGGAQLGQDPVGGPGLPPPTPLPSAGRPGTVGQGNQTC